ncbi:G-protein signaling regulator protein [Bonamia ostreae]|uniref:G-protein signaling regulator protein n=1 Tax=Bonamia ostreae TaxID=126728 RepID=A0ABV2AHM2_9EUKA
MKDFYREWSLIYLIFGVATATPLYFLLFERFEFQPLKTRSIFFTYVFIAAYESFGALTLILLYFPTMPCYVFFVIDQVIVVFMIHMMAFRSLGAYVFYLAAEEALKAKTFQSRKWYVRYNPSKRPLPFILLFVFTFIPLTTPIILFLAFKDNVYDTFYSCYLNFKEVFYVYSVIALDSVFIIFIGYKILSYNDSLNIKQELIYSGCVCITGLLLEILLMETNFSIITVNTTIMLVTFLLRIIIAVFPIVKSFDEQRIILTNKNSSLSPKKRLKILFENPVNKALFKKHLQSEFSVENILFYDAVQDMKRKESKYSEEDLRKAIDFIYIKYVEPNADFQVNISSKQRKNVQNKIDVLDSTIFDAAAEEIFTLMAVDSLPRFNPENNST